MGDGLLIEGRVAGLLLVADDRVELEHVVGVVGDGVLDVAEEIGLFLQGGDRVHPAPQLLIRLVELLVEGKLCAVVADRHELQLPHAALLDQGEDHFLEELVVAVRADGLAVLVHLFLGRHGLRQQAEHEAIALIKSQLRVSPLAEQVHDLVIFDDGVSIIDPFEVMHQGVEIILLLLL